MSRNGRGTSKTARPKLTRTSSAGNSRPLQTDFLRQLMHKKERAWARLTDVEKREEERKWRRFVKTLNESRGYRKILRDPL